jgi:hypothetical protein
MSVKIMSYVWDIDFKGSQKLVMLCLADFSNDDGACWPSIETIARKSGVSVTTVKTTINQLIKDGWLSKQSRPGVVRKGHRINSSNMYHLSVSLLMKTAYENLNNDKADSDPSRIALSDVDRADSDQSNPDQSKHKVLTSQNSVSDRAKFDPDPPSLDPLRDPLVRDLAPSKKLHEAEQRIPVYTIPLNRKNEFHNVYSEDIQAAQELYPAVDVNQEIRKMIGWSESNPRKRKTSRGIKAFMNTWLSREQDRGPRQVAVIEIPDQDELQQLRLRVSILESEMDSENIVLSRNMEMGGIQAAIDSSNGQLRKMAQERQELLAQIDSLQGAA